MTRRHVRPSDFGPSAEDESRFGSRRTGNPRWDPEERYRADDEIYGRGQRRETHPRDEAGAYRNAAMSEDYAAGMQLGAEASTRTAETLDSVVSWIERAQQQFTETAQAASRLEAAARETRADPQEGSLSEALAAIRRIEDRLAEQKQRPPARELPDFDKTLRGFETRLGEIAERLVATPKTAGRRPLKPGPDLKSAVDEIRFHQTRLERDPLEAHRSSGLPALGTLARSQTAMLTTLKQEIAKLATRINEIPLPGEHDQQVQREVETLRRSMAEVARRDDLSRLERGLQSLTEDILELRRVGEKSSPSQEIAALQTEIRRLSEQRPGPDFATLQAEIRRLSEQKPAPIDIGPIAQGIQSLSRKLDRVADGGVDPSVIVSLSDQIEHVRQSLAEASAPRAFGAMDQQLSAIRREIAEIGGRQIGPGEFETLRSTVEDLRASLQAMARAAGPRDQIAQAVREFGQPIETTLATLVEKLERVERRVSDPEALDHLERQIQTLAARMGETPSRDPAVAGLERSMAAILDQVSSWRDSAIEAAEHAARTAVAETIDSMPVAEEVERHLMEIGDRYAAVEERTRQSLSSVESSLTDVISRLSLLESEPRRGEGPRPPAAPSAAFAPRPDEPATAVPPPRAASPLPPEADAPLAPPPVDEVLLEPGAARPPVRPRGSGSQKQPTSDAAAAVAAALDSPDIKSSFIAAARRAAQAAAAESAGAAKSRPSAKAGQRGTPSPSELLGRVRQLIDSKRRPLLLAAAAIVLALGTMQIVRTQMSDRGPAATVAVTTAKPSAPPAATGSTANDMAAASAEQGEVTAATRPAPPPVPADPVTTQSIAPEPGLSSSAAPDGATVAAAAPKDSARIGEPSAPGPSAPAKLANTGDSSPLLPAGIKQAADRGDPVALYELAARTADGRGVARDLRAATILFGKAAEKGLAPAQYRLGNSYERGIGVTRDLEQAKTWYRRAAMGGNVRAMHNLAVLLADGGGAKPDYAGAVEWFSKAAEHGVKDSQFNLAVLYARGLGTSQDFARAYHWLAIAAQQGDDDAGRKRDEVGRRLSAADLARAKAGVERWQATPATVSANEVLVPPKGFPESVSASKRHSREARV